MMNLRKLISVRIYLLSFLESLLITACYTAAVFLCRPYDAETYLEYEGGALRIGVIAVTCLVTSYLFDFYRPPHTTSRLLIALQLCHLMGVVLLIQAAIAFVNTDLVLPQDVILVGSSLMLVLLVLWRLLLRPALWTSFGAQRVLFVGSSSAIDELVAVFSSQPARGMEVTGFVAEPGARVAGPILGTPTHFAEVVAQVAPDRIIVASSFDNRPILKDLLDLRAEGMTVETGSQAYESAFGRIDCLGLNPYVAVFLDDLRAPAGSVALQSVYTNVLGLAATFISIPFLFLIAVALAVTRRGRVFTTIPCIGLHGIPFKLYRFHCEDHEKGLLARLLIRYRFAGLPQVLNIIRGELALIGPRPEHAAFDNELCGLIPFYRQKQSVKPGIFGWSQLHCDADPEENTLRRLEYDLYYIKHISVPLDMYIVLRALKSVMSGTPVSQRHEQLGIVAEAHR
jgi:lipopolysaccharide/colanic/teichoic acid biosynthesis glycosyltransferase